MVEQSIATLFCLFAWTMATTLNDDHRLPNTVVPLQYHISLRPYLIKTGAQLFKFDGSITIKILAKEEIKTISLNSKNLEYKTRQYWKENATLINLTSFALNEDTSIINYTLPTPLLKGEIYYLHFDYTGILGDDMKGFYRSSYVQNNQTKWLSASFFAPNYARRAFPCWDEPSFKATFIIDITRPNYMKSYTNTRLLYSKRIDDNYSRDFFTETPLMSTYLSTFLVGEFRERANEDYMIIARPDYFEQTRLAYEVGQKLLTYLSNYFGINYYEMGIPKLASVAIPDFSAGAMENWGLIGYKEQILLYDSSSSSLSYKQDTTSIIAHEQTHLWFGDLVTCDWWSYTWLNEGFAEYFQFMATDLVDASFDLAKQFVVVELQTVMEFDSTNGTNPMNDINTDTASLLNRNFNIISYNKGASFIRMVKHILGDKQFQYSLQNYIKDRQYQTSEPHDIYRYWAESFPSEFKAFAKNFFESFTWQVGYPVVNIQLAKDKKSFKITQKRFLLNSTDGSDQSLLYTVPFTYTTNVQKDFKTTSPALFLSPFNSTISVDLHQAVDWVIGNIQEVGYYRVNYDTETWTQIRKALFTPDWSSIHELNRAQIVNDLFNLARANEISYNSALNVLEYLSTETSYLPWYAAINGFSYLSKRLGVNNEFSTFMLKLTRNAFNTLGFVEKLTDKPFDIFLRASILSWNCQHGNEACISTSKSYFRNMTVNPIPVNIRAPVFCTSMREGSVADFEALLLKYKTETVPTEKAIILQSLGCVKNESLIRKYVQIIISNDIRRQDKVTALSSLHSNNNENATPLFEVIKENHSDLADALGGYTSLAVAISSIAECFTTESQLSELKTFNRLYKSTFGESIMTLEKAESSVRINLNWQKTRLQVVREYIHKKSSGSSSIKSFSSLAILFIAFFTKYFIH